jgi:hypothetical protein
MSGWYTSQNGFEWKEPQDVLNHQTACVDPFLPLVCGPIIPFQL